MVRHVGLDDGAARPRSPPRPTDRLTQELVGPLGAPLIGQVEGDVGRDDADQRHGRDVEALGHEAGADEHVQGAVGERVHDAVGSALALDDVAVEASDAQAREAVTDLALDALGAAAEVADAG